MSSWTGIPELKDSYRKLGPRRFWPVMLGTLTWIMVGVWLQMSLDYPHAYGSSCRGKCLIEDYWYSPALLHHGGAREWLLFLWLWMIVALPLAALLWRITRPRPDNLESTSYISDPE